MISNLTEYQEIVGKGYEKLIEKAKKLMRDQEKSLVLWGPSGTGKSLLLQFLLKVACNEIWGPIAHLEIMPTRKTALGEIISQLGGKSKGEASELAARIRTIIRTSERPVYLFLDDVRSNLNDAFTTDLVSFLKQEAVLLVATADLGVNKRLLWEIKERLRVGPLTRGEAEEFIKAQIQDSCEDTEFCTKQLRMKTLGNPGVICSTVKTLLKEGRGVITRKAVQILGFQGQEVGYLWEPLIWVLFVLLFANRYVLRAISGPSGRAGLVVGGCGMALAIAIRLMSYYMRRKSK